MMLLTDPVAPESGGEKRLFLSYTGASARFDLIQVEPTRNGAPVAYESVANPGKLTLRARGGGSVEFCYGEGETLLIRAEGGLGLRFGLRFRAHEQFMDRLDGTVYAAFAEIGEFLFEPTAGTQTHNGKWIAPAMLPADTEIDWTPAADGALAGYVHYAPYSVNRPHEALGDFDAHAAANLADYESWCEKYAPVPARYEHLRLFAIYVIWICYAEPKGELKVNFVLMMRNGALMRAMGWHQSYQAMAAWKDLDVSIHLLHSMFTLQDEYGQLPDGASDKYCTMLAPKPPFQGFAISYILDRIGGMDGLTREHCELLYEPMCKWVHSRTDYRSDANTNPAWVVRGR
jgi:hypothetical protein